MILSRSKFHFIGIGGIGMSGLAEVLHTMGAQVTGSDLSANAQVEHLRQLNIPIAIGHSADNLGNPDVVVYSSAVKANNEEYRAARSRKIPLIPRAEALAEIMHLKRGIAVAGTHGKTTTTSLLASIFLEAKKDPTIVVGGRLDTIKSTALLGDGEWMIAEADESDGSFAKLSPEIVVITNIDNDHMDHYQSFANLKQAFGAFAQQIPFYGVAVVCGDDPVICEVLRDFPKRYVTYGFGSENDFVLVKLDGGSYSVHQRGGGCLGDFRLPIPGRHNALNALATIIVSLEAGISFADCAGALERFRGVDRRFQFKGRRGSVDIYDDYGHHPTEVRAVLAACREKFPERRLVVIFQPHRFTRTESCWSDFITCFDVADRVFLLDIYAAGEAPIAGITSEALVAQMDPAKATHVGPVKGAVERIRGQLAPGDLVMTLGAGNVWQVGIDLLEDSTLKG